MPVSQRATYLNTALMSPLPVAAASAMAADAERAGRLASEAYDERTAEAEACRAAAARLLGVDAEDLSFTRNTTDGLAVIAAGLDWRDGDRVVVPADDHPNAALCWRAQAHRGVEVDRIPAEEPMGALPLESFARALASGQGRVRVVAVSWVQAHDGWRSDLEALAALAHEHGALLCVDAIQAAGVVPAALAEWGVDAAAAGVQKWLMGPHGLGLLFVDAELRDRLRPSAVGGASVVGDGGPGPVLDLVESSRRFEGGALNHTAIAGLGASLALLDGVGPDAVWAWVDRLCDRVAAGLSDLGVDVVSDRSLAHRSSLVTARWPGISAADAVAGLAEAGVVVAARSGGVRVSPHVWNTDTDVDHLLVAASDLARHPDGAFG